MRTAGLRGLGPGLAVLEGIVTIAVHLLWLAVIIWLAVKAIGAS